MSVNGEIISYQQALETAVDATIDALENAAAAGIELDPLQTILGRMKERGQALNLDDAPPLLRMLLSGME